MSEAPTTHRVTALLTDWSRGDRSALDRLLPLVYQELRRIARQQLRRERPDLTLQATGLVHEAYLRLVNQRQVHWTDRAHFLGVAAHLMRRVLVDQARRRQADKRGGGEPALSLSAAAGDVAAPAPVVAVHEALERLAVLDAQQARIIELRVFGGLTIEEAAHVLGVSPSTVTREWRSGKAWLHRELFGSTDA